MELFGDNKGWLIAVKNSTVLQHYPRKIKYLESILKYPNKDKFFVIEGKISLIIPQGYI